MPVIYALVQPASVRKRTLQIPLTRQGREKSLTTNITSGRLRYACQNLTLRVKMPLKSPRILLCEPRHIVSEAACAVSTHQRSNCSVTMPFTVGAAMRRMPSAPVPVPGMIGNRLAEATAPVASFGSLTLKGIHCRSLSQTAREKVAVKIAVEPQEATTEFLLCSGCHGVTQLMVDENGSHS